MTVVQLEVKDQIAYLTVTRPDALNALNAQVMRELSEALRKIEQDSKIRCVVVSGSGEKAFVAGADIKEIGQLDTVSALEFAKLGQSVFRRLERLSQPTIALVRGFALGGGFELALSCDMIIASEKAQFGLPECTLGLLPGFGGTVRLSRCVGPQRAKEIALTGGFYSAQSGMTLGFVNRVYSAETVESEVSKLAQTLCTRAPLALQAIKTSIDTGMHLSAEDAFALEAQLFQQLFQSEDQKEGVKAFIEKRKPQFTGK